MRQTMAIRAKRDHIFKQRLPLSFGNGPEMMDLDN
jgi:hypothetical protein